MRIVITGANGAVGQAILRYAPDAADANTLVAAVRSERAVEEIGPLLGENSTAVRIAYDDPASLDAAFRGASAIVHLAGILIESAGSNYEQANVASTRNVAEAARRCGAEKLVFVSAVGADEKSTNGYFRSKGQAEAIVRGSGLPYSILRAPLLLGPVTEGGKALARNARGSKAKMIGGGRNLQQPLYVNDLARAAIAAAQPAIATNRTLDLVGPVSLPDRELVERAARMLGHEVRIGSIHQGLLCLALGIRRRFRGPGFSPDVVEVIMADTRLDPQPAASALGLPLTGVDQMIKDSLDLGRTK
jgi:NADH dehydrogenase